MCLAASLATAEELRVCESLMCDLDSCGQRFTFAGESNVFVCPVELSVRLIFPVENQRVTLVILELAWKG